jgi:hypothetical protein
MTVPPEVNFRLLAISFQPRGRRAALLYLQPLLLEALNDFVQVHTTDHGGDKDCYGGMAGRERGHGWSRAESTEAPADAKES